LEFCDYNYNYKYSLLCNKNNLSNYLYIHIIKQLLLYIVSQQINTIEQVLVILGNNVTTLDNYLVLYVMYARLQVDIKQQVAAVLQQQKASKEKLASSVALLLGSCEDHGTPYTWRWTTGAVESVVKGDMTSIGGGHRCGPLWLLHGSSSPSLSLPKNPR
jgi:hypothetical protein